MCHRVGSSRSSRTCSSGNPPFIRRSNQWNGDRINHWTKCWKSYCSINTETYFTQRDVDRRGFSFKTTIDPIHQHHPQHQHQSHVQQLDQLDPRITYQTSYKRNRRFPRALHSHHYQPSNSRRPTIHPTSPPHKSHHIRSPSQHHHHASPCISIRSPSIRQTTIVSFPCPRGIFADPTTTSCESSGEYAELERWGGGEEQSGVGVRIQPTQFTPALIIFRIDLVDSFFWAVTR